MNKKSKKGNIKNLAEVTKGYFNVPIEGNAEADEVWRILFIRNLKNLKGKAHSLFFRGLQKLPIDEKRVPKVPDLHEKIQSCTGWKLTPTNDEYSDSKTWFNHLGKRSFLVTKFIRSRKNLEYTPFPEAFHDIFGHLPFMVNERYAKIVYKFAKKYNSIKGAKEKLKFANFWWYVIEFGLIKEKGTIKALGAGLMSSYGECNNAFSDKVTLSPFIPLEMGNTPISDHEFHKKLFVAESFAQIEKAVEDWSN